MFRKLLLMLALLLAFPEPSLARAALEAIPARPGKEIGIYGVSRDGSTLSGVVSILPGEIDVPVIDEAFVWTRARGVQLLGYLPGLSTRSIAYAIGARRGRRLVAVGHSLTGVVYEPKFGWEEEVFDAEEEEPED